jgi:hypothetical protein
MIYIALNTVVIDGKTYAPNEKIDLKEKKTIED